MSFKRNSKYLPLVIASLFVLIHLFEVVSTPDNVNLDGDVSRYLMNDDVKHAGIGLAVVWLSIFLSSNLWKQLFGILILLSFSPLVEFFSSSLFLGIAGLDINLMSMTLLIAHIVLNPVSIQFLRPPKADKDYQIKHFEASVELFMKRFKDKSTQELELMSENPSMAKEAREAAKRLLEKT